MSKRTRKYSRAHPADLDLTKQNMKDERHFGKKMGTSTGGTRESNRRMEDGHTTI
jgi:hypothetical protein